MDERRTGKLPFARTGLLPPPQSMEELCQRVRDSGERTPASWHTTWAGLSGVAKTASDTVDGSKNGTEQIGIIRALP